MSPSARAETLYDVCGPPGTRYPDPNSQFAKYCQAGHASRQAWLKDDNGYRVWLPVAFVCGYGCITPAAGAGAQTPICGSTQDSCNQASKAGYKAYSLSTTAGSDLNSARNNGKQAMALARDKVANRASPAPDLSTACGRAFQFQAAQDRIDCALENDSELPKIVKDPRFQAEFERITGHPLQQLINQSGSNMMNTAGPEAIKHAYDGLKDKMSFQQFLNGASGIVGGILKNFPVDSDRARFIASAIPAPFRSAVSGAASNITANTGAPGDKLALKSRDSKGAPVTLTSPNGMPDYASVPLDIAGNPHGNQLSIFEQVSLRYRMIEDRLTQ